MGKWTYSINGIYSCYVWLPESTPNIIQYPAFLQTVPSILGEIHGGCHDWPRYAKMILARPSLWFLVDSKWSPLKNDLGKNMAGVPPQIFFRAFNIECKTVIMWYHLLYSRFQVYRTTHWKDNYYVTITYDVDVINIYQSFLSSCISWNSQLVQLWSALAWHPARMATPRNSTHHATIPGATVAGLFFPDVYNIHIWEKMGSAVFITLW